MRILILGNMLNNGYVVAKTLRKMGIEIDIATNKSDVPLNMPEWEELIQDNHGITQEWKPPSWFHYIQDVSKFPTLKNLANWYDGFRRLQQFVKEYDVVEAHYPYGVHSQFTDVPYIIYDAGWIRDLVYDKGIRNIIARRSYRKASKIMIANPETRPFLRKLVKEDKIIDIPYSVDHSKYKPSDATSIKNEFCTSGEQILLLLPTRQEWTLKRTNLGLKGYAKFLKHFPDSLMICSEWGIDLEKSKELVNSLGIAQKIKWIKPVMKDKLIRLYNAADIVLDQFGSVEQRMGFYGAISAEAMSCGKPVLCNIEHQIISNAYHGIPPLIKCTNEDEIAANLLKLARDESLRKELGRKGREWVLNLHSPERVAKMHLDVLTEVMK